MQSYNSIEQVPLGKSPGGHCSDKIPESEGSGSKAPEAAVKASQNPCAVNATHGEQKHSVSQSGNRGGRGGHAPKNGGNRSERRQENGVSKGAHSKKGKPKSEDKVEVPQTHEGMVQATVFASERAYVTTEVLKQYKSTNLVAMCNKSPTDNLMRGDVHPMGTGHMGLNPSQLTQFADRAESRTGVAGGLMKIHYQAWWTDEDYGLSVNAFTYAMVCGVFFFVCLPFLMTGRTWVEHSWVLPVLTVLFLGARWRYGGFFRHHYLKWLHCSVPITFHNSTMSQMWRSVPSMGMPAAVRDYTARLAKSQADVQNPDDMVAYGNAVFWLIGTHREYRDLALFKESRTTRVERALNAHSELVLGVVLILSRPTIWFAWIMAVLAVICGIFAVLYRDLASPEPLLPQRVVRTFGELGGPLSEVENKDRAVVSAAKRLFEAMQQLRAYVPSNKYKLLPAQAEPLTVSGAKLADVAITITPQSVSGSVPGPGLEVRHAACLNGQARG